MANRTFKKIKFPAIISLLVILLSLPLAVFFGVKKEKKYLGRAYVFSLPQEVMISNVHPKGFTVSWTTNQATLGNVLFYGEGVTGQNLIATFRNVRKTGAAQVITKVHYINVFDQLISGVSLRPNKTYYFRIQSGTEGNFYCGRSQTDLNRQFANISCANSPASTFTFQVKTPRIVSDESQPPSPANPYGAYSLEEGAFLPCPDGSLNPENSPCFRPNPIIVSLDNRADVIAYLTIINQNGSFISSNLSCLTAQSGSLLGKCLIDLANFWKADLSSYLPYNPASDKLLIVARGGDQGFSFIKRERIPEVIADACLSDSLHCQVSPSGQTMTVLELITPPTQTPSPIPTILSSTCQSQNGVCCKGQYGTSNGVCLPGSRLINPFVDYTSGCCNPGGNETTWNVSWCCRACAE